MVTFANRAKVSTSTTGTGTISLSGAVDGYQSFTSAGVVNSDVVRYTIEDGDAWEIGSGTYSSGTLTRVLDESSTGSLLNLSGDAVVYVTATGEDIVQPSDLATVATTGAYNDLSGLPTLGTAAATDATAYATAAQGSLADSAVQPNDSPTFGSVTVTGTVDGRDVAADGTKLDGIEAGATADQTAGEIKTAYESNANTNAFTDAEQTKLAGIEATADVTDAGNVNPLVDGHLNTSSATSGQYLGWNGSDYVWSTVSGYTNSDVDTHLNTGTASSGEVLSWNGSDYDWIESGGAFSVVGTNNLAAITTLPDITTGTDNFAAGNNAGVNLTTGSNNVALGVSAASSITNGFENIAIGKSSLGLSQSGYGNVAIGLRAIGGSNTSGNNNVGIGYEAGKFLTTGRANVLLGIVAGASLTTGPNNVAIGNLAGANLTTGSNNVAIGEKALYAATTGGRNIAIGQLAMGLGVAINNGDNVAIGYQAGYDITSATSNVLLGYRAGWDVTTGTGNVAIGQEVGDAITTGSTNVAIGLGCLSAITTASSDIAIGYNAMVSATSTSPDNIAIGQDVMRAVSSGGNNTGVGSGSLRSLGVGSNNTAFGYDALKGTFGSASHSNNTGVGHSAGLLLTTGTNNTFVGYQAGDATTTGSNQIVIGQGSDASSATVSNEITLGNSSIATLRCQVTTITSLSDARDKTDIQPLNAGLDFVEALNPVSFTWDMRDGGKVGVADTGFIAQDLQAAQADTGVTIPDLVYDVNPDKLEAGYGKLIPVLVQAIKDLSEKVKDLEAKLEAK